MTTHYEVLRPVEPADLDTHARFVKVLKAIPPDGYVTFEQFRRFEKNHAVGGIGHACLRGILRRASPYERILKLNSVQFWCTQFEEPGYKHITPQHNTRASYLGSLSKFDNWMRGRAFPSYDDVVPDGTVSFENVERLMKYCEKPANGPRVAQRAMHEYTASLRAGGASAGVQVAARSAIKSYFAVHDIALELPKSKKKRAEHAPDNAQMSLEDFYKMLQNGRPSIMVRAIILIKLQSGMDSATFTDRFNYEGYAQIVKHFKTDDYKSWNLGTCPVPIKTVRVKKGIPYTTFIDHDAVVLLQEYLAWKEAKHGRHDGTKPLFVTNRGRPIYSSWLSTNFSEVAVRAGIQEKVSNRVFKMRGHAVRHLLKSILITSGCAQYAAEHVLGHAPRDAYEKQAILYPEMIRAEYAKASSRLNIFSKIESTLNSPKDPESQEARIRELEAEVAALKQSKAGEDFTDEKHKNIINGMNEKINRLLRLFDTLPDDIKEMMPDEIDG